MLQVVFALRNYSIEAKDGRLGAVSDFLFDDTTWKGRWLVVDTGRWLRGSMVLMHPSSISNAEHGAREFTVALTKKQVEHSPDILQARPVSLQMQNDLYCYYGWDPLWGGGMYGGGLWSEHGRGRLAFSDAGLFRRRASAGGRTTSGRRR